MRPHLLLVVALTACFDEAAETTPAAPTAVAPKAKAKADAEPATPAAPATDTAFGADTAAALSSLEEQLRAKPEDESLWIKVESAAMAANDASGLFDRLGADPVGGQTAKHHLLRASLALAAEKPAEAYTAAQAAQAEAPNEAAALIAEALLAGAEAAETDGEPGPAAQLGTWALAANERAARGSADAALAVAGWRAALLRARVRASRDDTAGALEELATAAADSDPRATVRANAARAALALAPGSEVSVADAAGWSKTALETALEAGMVAEVLSSADLATALHLRAVDPDAGVALLAAAVERFDSSAPGAAHTGALHAQLALAAGLPVQAAASAKAALAVEAATADDKAAAAWSLAWASWDLARAADARAAADALEGPRAQMADAMALFLEGKTDGARAQLVFTGLSDREVAYSRRMAALIDPSNALEHLQAAVTAADRTRDPVLAVQTRLSLESVARGLRNKAARTARAELAKMAPAGPEGDGLRAELGARELLAGGTATSTVGPWSALSAGTASDDTAPTTAAVSAWATARAALAGKEPTATDRLKLALERLPTQRHGALSAGTALDGSQGVGVSVDLSALAGAADAESAYNALLVHEVSHRVTVGRADAAAGRRIDQELDAGLAEELLSAAARARAGMVRYHAGAAGLPDEAFKALATVEGKVAASAPSLSRSFPTAPPSLSEIREELDGAALVSVVLGPETAHGLVLTARAGAVRDIGRTSSLAALASSHRAALVSAVGKGARASHKAGNGLRAAILDPFMQDLSGFGRYLVMVPGDVFTFPFTTFPEQADGLRWLADIRTMANAPDLRRLAAPPEQEDVAYNPDFLGMGAPMAEAAPADAEEAQDEEDQGGTSNEDLMRKYRQNADLPMDLGSAAEQFGEDFRSILVRTDATVANYKEKAPKARYIHLSEIEAAPAGGLALADGELTLSTLRTVPLQAELVILTASASPEVQQLRARALLDAGARSVLVASWEVPPTVLDRLFDGFYEAINRDRPPATAAREARESLMRTSLNASEQDDPADWGSLLLYSRP